MKDLSLMRKHIKKCIDTADDKTVEIVFKILEDEGDGDPLANLSPEQEASLRKSMRQADRGEVTPHEEVMKKYKKWLSK
jgi:hypothetical protein